MKAKENLRMIVEAVNGGQRDIHIYSRTLAKQALEHIKPYRPNAYIISPPRGGVILRVKK